MRFFVSCQLARYPAITDDAFKLNRYCPKVLLILNMRRQQMR